MMSSLSRWLRSPRTVQNRAAGRKKTSCKLHLEALEDRVVPSTLLMADGVMSETGPLDTFVLSGSGGLGGPKELLFAEGKLYVANQAGNSVLRYDAMTGAFLDTFVRPEDNGGLLGPWGLAFGPDGNFYVTSRQNDRVLRYQGLSGSSPGAFIDDFVLPADTGGLDDPVDLAFGPDGDLFVTSANTNQVLRYDGVSRAFEGVFASGLDFPASLTFGPEGHLYVGNINTDEVLHYGSDGTPLGAFVTAQNGGLDIPRGITFGPDGHLYVVSGGNHQVLRYNGATGDFIDAIVSSGAGGLDDPIHVAFGPQGDLFVSSRDTNEVRRYSQGLSVYLDVAAEQAVTVDFSTSNGTALAGSDYAVLSGTLTFAPGEISKRILLSTIDDTVGEPTETFTVNLSNPVGATITDGVGVGTILDNETKFFVVDDGTSNLTYEYGSGGVSVENYSLNNANTAPRGAASNAAGTTVWVVDANKKVYVYNVSGGLLGSWTAGSLAANATVEGIASNGTDIWIVDNKQDKVFKYTGAATRLSGSQNAASSFSLNSGNTNPKDMVTDGASLWVVNDSSTDKVFKYTLAGALLGSWTIGAVNSQPTGITIDPSSVNHIWIVDAGTDRVYQYDGAASRTSGSQNPSTSFALAAGNTNPQGIADPPVAGGSLASAPGSVLPAQPVTFAGPARTPGVDGNAAGWGLLGATTAGADPEFLLWGNQGEQSRMDVWTTLFKGQALGQDHDDDGAAEMLAAGTWRMPNSDKSTARTAGLDLIFAEQSMAGDGESNVPLLWKVIHETSPEEVGPRGLRCL